MGTAILTNGPFGLSLLRPQSLFGLDLPPLAHGVFWSLSLNILAYIGLSLGRAPAAIERMQADLFVPTSLTPVAELSAVAVVGQRRGIDHVGGALSRRGAHQQPRSRVSRARTGSA